MDEAEAHFSCADGGACEVCFLVRASLRVVNIEICVDVVLVKDEEVVVRDVDGQSFCVSIWSRVRE